MKGAFSYLLKRKINTGQNTRGRGRRTDVSGSREVTLKTSAREKSLCYWPAFLGVAAPTSPEAPQDPPLHFDVVFSTRKNASAQECGDRAFVSRSNIMGRKFHKWDGWTFLKYVRNELIKKTFGPRYLPNYFYWLKYSSAIIITSDYESSRSQLYFDIFLIHQENQADAWTSKLSQSVLILIEHT